MQIKSIKLLKNPSIFLFFQNLRFLPQYIFGLQKIKNEKVYGARWPTRDDKDYLFKFLCAIFYWLLWESDLEGQ